MHDRIVKENRFTLTGLTFQRVSVRRAAKSCRWPEEHATDMVPITEESREKGLVNLQRPAYHDPFLPVTV